jgi:hypothetical protein
VDKVADAPEKVAAKIAESRPFSGLANVHSCFNIQWRVSGAIRLTQLALLASFRIRCSQNSRSARAQARNGAQNRCA